VLVFLSFILILAFIPYLGLALDSFGKGWALTPIPVKYTLQYFERVAFETPNVHHQQPALFRGYRSRSVSPWGCRCLVMSRTKLPGRDVLDSLTTLILALPGTGIGIAYMRAFRDPFSLHEHGPHRHVDRHSIVLAVRRLPYTVRGPMPRS